MTDLIIRNSIDDLNFNRYDDNYLNNIGNINGFHPSIRSYAIEDQQEYIDYGYSENSENENLYERNSRDLSDSRERNNNSPNNEFSF